MTAVGGKEEGTKMWHHLSLHCGCRPCLGGITKLRNVVWNSPVANLLSFQIDDKDDLPVLSAMLRPRFILSLVSSRIYGEIVPYIVFLCRFRAQITAFVGNVTEATTTEVIFCVAWLVVACLTATW